MNGLKKSSTDDYSYDANGNMIKDLNKGITNIDYNYLNLPELVTFDANKYIKYYYDAAGTKVRQEVFEDAIATKVTDYMGETLVEDNLIAQIAHDEGRIVPHRTETDSIDRYMYQYHLTDHLGNIRVTFGEEEIDSYTATMESEDQDQKEKEEAIFNNMHTRFINSQANHTNAGDEVSRLNNTQPIGPAISLKVYPGDDIDMNVYAYYNSSSGYGSQIAQTTWINELASAFGGVNGAAGEAGAIYDGINAIGAGLFGGSNGSTVPAAYLNYILFDEDFVQIPGGFGFVSITSAALNSQEHLVQSTVTIDQSGYIFVYVSNESNSTNWVYFDDLNVIRTEGEIKQESHYYPFGLALKGIGKEGNNRFKYNGFEEQDELQLGLYDYQARYYDPALGRFINIDPAADLMRRHSPYNYAFDNPIRFIDPDGMAPAWIPEVNKEGEVQYVAEQGDNAATFASQFGLTTQQASAILDKSGLKAFELGDDRPEIQEGTIVTGEAAEEVTGDEVLKLDFDSEEATPQRKTEQTLFAIDHSAANDNETFNVSDFFQNFEGGIFDGKLHTSFEGNISIDGENVNVKVTDFPIKYGLSLDRKPNITGGKQIRDRNNRVVRNFDHRVNPGHKYPGLNIQVPENKARQFSKRYYSK